MSSSSQDLIPVKEESIQRRTLNLAAEEKLQSARDLHRMVCVPVFNKRLDVLHGVSPEVYRTLHDT